MKKLDINITKAQLVSFSVELKDNKPEVSATIALLTQGGKSITTYSIRTDAWNDTDKFELPIEVMPHIGMVAKILEGITVRHCRDGQLGIAATTPSSIKVKEPVIDDYKPINRDGIGF